MTVDATHMDEVSRGRSRLEPPAVSLRLARPVDAATLSRAAVRFFADSFGAMNSAEDMTAYLSRAFSEAQQRAELMDASNRIWLATAGDGELAGYAHVRRDTLPSGDASMPCDRPVEIARLYAGERWHGQGVGAALMGKCIETARGWGGDVLWLGVWERNPRAIAFYTKHGFQAVGKQTFLLGADLQQDLVMALHLTTDR
jgi:GNAT superfamily N-acetyltransferase